MQRQKQKRFYPRIRTGLFPADGGLDEKTQYIREGLMLPDQENPTPKLYINSVMKDRENPAAPEESLSIRLATRQTIATAFVGFVLAIREWNKHTPKEENISKDELIRRIKASWKGHFDAQVHVYGLKR